MPVSLRQAGWPRAIAFIAVGVVFAYVLDGLLRLLFGYDNPFGDSEAAVTVGLIVVPFFFLIGLGLFDYWFHWAAGRPTLPRGGAMESISIARSRWTSDTPHAPPSTPRPDRSS